MEKKKMKLWKKILIVLAILLIILIIFIGRKVIILSNLDNKVSDYENNYKNIYIKTIFDYNDYKSESERFVKDNVDKLVIEKTDNTGEKSKIIQITYENERKMFTEANGNKIMNVYKEETAVRGAHIEDSANFSYSVIRNFAYATSLPERILDAIVTKIKLVEIDNKQCYELSSTHNSNFLYSENTSEMKAYVEKDTGLPVKMIEVVNENGERKENISTFECKFNIVTDEDIKEPNNDEYKLQEL